MLLSPQAMHIPDGFLSGLVLAVCWGISVIVIVYAFIRVKRDMDERKVPLMGVVAAAIFAGQMLNFPVAAGTSGHLLGAALATILLGPWAAVLVMTIVVGAQALIFQTAALWRWEPICSTWPSLACLCPTRSIAPCSVFPKARSGASLWAAFWRLGLRSSLRRWRRRWNWPFRLPRPLTSPCPPWRWCTPSSVLAKGLITVGALAFVYAVRPDLVKTTDQKQVGGKAVWIAGLLIAIALAVASPLASTHPDGLEFVAEQQGFIEKAQANPYDIIPDYVMPGIANEDAATIAAGILGVIVVFFVAIGVAYLRRNRTTSSASSRS